MAWRTRLSSRRTSGRIVVGDALHDPEEPQMRPPREANWLAIPLGVSISQLQPADPTAVAASAAPSVLEVAEAREHFAAPETVEDIAAWVNEGGAGGEVKR
jgi:hypothetical protein